MSHLLFSQNVEKKGFVGLNAGVSYILNKQVNSIGDPKLKVGINLNLVNFGYELKKGFGIGFKWTKAIHSDTPVARDIDTGNPVEIKFRNNYDVLSLGPMYSFHLSETFRLDCKLQPSLFWTKDKVESDVGGGVYRTTSWKRFTAEVMLRHNFSTNWCWMVLASYNGGPSTRITFEGDWFHIINLNAGVGLRF